MSNDPLASSRREFLITSAVAASALTLSGCSNAASRGQSSDAVEDALLAPLAWPPITAECRPWCFNWWMGSAVDPDNLAEELRRYKAGGLGGVRIIPIYGARGWEKQYIQYLSPKWLQMMSFDVVEARRLDMGVDMTQGTGWNMGGPGIVGNYASLFAKAIAFDAPADAHAAWTVNLPREKILYLQACSRDGRRIDLKPSQISPDGKVNWERPTGVWMLVALIGHPGAHVKRAAPGGWGMMLNTVYPPAMTYYLERFTKAFATPGVQHPQSMFHDSYEYMTGVPRGYGEWSADFFDSFKKRRGYALEDHLSALAGHGDPDTVGRVKSDYRETVSDVMVDEVFSQWTHWCHQRGMLNHNQAHGSPTNLLDFYAVADMPEPENNFGTPDTVGHCDPLIAKFASSAAHVPGKRWVSSETGTWLTEHFKVTLADMKKLVDQFFVGGVNHLFYHGTCFSRDDAAWPGWLFYASTDMNPRMSIWHDVPTLNNYIARSQSILQEGKPDSDVLLYWPIYDQWHNPEGLGQYQTMTNFGDWFYGHSIGNAARYLWRNGIGFDYISDKLLQQALVTDGRINTPGCSYQAIVIASAKYMPPATLEKILALAAAGAKVIFENSIPVEPPGWTDLAARQAHMRKLAASVPLISAPRVAATKRTRSGPLLRAAKINHGHVFVGTLAQAIEAAEISRETLTEHSGLMYIRRRFEGGRHYFLAYQGKTTLDTHITLDTPAKSVVVMDPMTGACAPAIMTHDAQARPTLRIRMEPNTSLILRTLDIALKATKHWTFYTAGNQHQRLMGTWDVDFIDGGPSLPRGYETRELTSWTNNGDPVTQRFSGTARYTLTFNAPPGKGPWLLNLGKVCSTARVRLNTEDVGVLIQPPYELVLHKLKPADNVLEVEVTNLPANRIRYLDRKHIAWKIFRDANFVNIDYRPFNAAHWPIMESGLLGPVTLSSAR
jgi:hypothetical protein